jgi:hypothetical protein
MSPRILLPLLFLIPLLLVGCGQRVVVNVAGHPHDAAGVTPARAAVLASGVDAEGRVDFATLITDEQILDRAVAGIAVAAIPDDRVERLAYLLNVYHVLGMKTVLVQGLPGELDTYFTRLAFYGRTTFTVDGQWLTLNDLLEQQIAPSGDPRLFAVLNGMAACFPRLRPEAFTAPPLDQQLETAMREFVDDPRHVRIENASRRIVLSPLLGRYHQILGLADEAAVLDLIDRYRAKPLPSDYQVVYAPWDWTIVYQDELGED